MLSPAQLVHYGAMLSRIRAEHLREQLNAQVSAAAVVSDGGKAAEKIDAALRDASKRPTVEIAKEPEQGPLTGRQAAQAESIISAASSAFRTRRAPVGGQ